MNPESTQDLIYEMNVLINAIDNVIALKQMANFNEKSIREYLETINNLIEKHRNLLEVGEKLEMDKNKLEMNKNKMDIVYPIGCVNMTSEDPTQHLLDDLKKKFTVKGQILKGILKELGMIGLEPFMKRKNIEWELILNKNEIAERKEIELLEINERKKIEKKFPGLTGLNKTINDTFDGPATIVTNPEDIKFLDIRSKVFQ